MTLHFRILTAARMAVAALRLRGKSERAGVREGGRTRTSNSSGTVFKVHRVGEVVIVELLVNDVKLFLHM